MSVLYIISIYITTVVTDVSASLDALTFKSTFTTKYQIKSSSQKLLQNKHVMLNRTK